MTAGALVDAAGTTEAPTRPGRTLAELVRASALRCVVLGASKDPNAKVTLLLVSPDGGAPVLAAKTPTTTAAALAVEREARALREIRALEPRLVLDAIPRVVELVEHEGWPTLVTTALVGRPLASAYFRAGHTSSRRRVRHDLEAAASWLADFQAGTAAGELPLGLVEPLPARLAARFADDPELPSDLERLVEIEARLRRETVRGAAVHGDYWLGNLLVRGGAVSGVVDWESAERVGQPVRDVVRFAVSYALYLDRRTRPGRPVRGHRGLRADSWGAALAFAVDGGGWFPELFRAFVRDGLARLGASPAVWRDAVLAGVAEIAATTDDEEFARRHLELYRRLARPPGSGS